MDLKHRVITKKAEKPSKIWMLIALVIAFSLPYFLVKTFRDKPNKQTQQNLSLPRPTAKIKVKVQKPQIQSTQNAPVPKSKTTSTPIPEEKTPSEEWEIVTTRNGDTLTDIFKRLGLSQKTLYAILHKNAHAKDLSVVKPNQQVQFLIQDGVLEKMIYPLSTMKTLEIYRKGDRYLSRLNSRKITTHNHYITATVKNSLYMTAKRNKIPYRLIQQMSHIFNWEIDFSRDVREGDQFTIVYKAFFVENQQVGIGDIVAVTYKNRNRTFKAIRHVDKNGHYDYYTPEGKSLRKAFTRYPVKFSHISSPFSLSRNHPILKRRRPHKGVDLAATLGTPIRAIGDGRIKNIGPNNGYGNMITIEHNKTYTTVYAHLLKFRKGLSKGDTVKRGDIIGYVGQSGLATGPHCHFEFHINNVPKNPTTVDLPHAAPVATHEMASFRSHSDILLAQMQLYEEALTTAHHEKNKPISATA